MSGLFQSSIQSLPLVYRGKVRDSYAVGDDKLLIVTTDRLSAFDVVMNQPIPDKGRVLNTLSNFWFEKLAHIAPNHSTGIAPESVVNDNEQKQVRDRAIVAMKLKPLPVEAVVRGYLIGSGWKDYQHEGSISGVALPAGLKMASKLPEPIFTPANKADLGMHDENISFEHVKNKIGAELANRIRSVSLALYAAAAQYATTRGIIVADTKFEFGVDRDGNLRLMDEVLTADSSRFWPADQYQEGSSPPSFDKQFVRDWLEEQRWNKAPPPPDLPPEVVEQTAARYREALSRLTGQHLAAVMPAAGARPPEACRTN